MLDVSEYRDIRVSRTRLAGDSLTDKHRLIGLASQSIPGTDGFGRERIGSVFVYGVPRIYDYSHHNLEHPTSDKMLRLKQQDGWEVVGQVQLNPKYVTYILRREVQE